MNGYDGAFRTLRWVMLIFLVLFLGADLVFLFASPLLFKMLDLTAPWLGLSNAGFTGQNFYLALSNSMMIMIAYISYKVWQNPRENLNLLPVLILSKTVSSLTGLVLFVLTSAFGYLAIFVADFPLAVIAFLLYRKIKAALAG